MWHGEPAAEHNAISLLWIIRLWLVRSRMPESRIYGPMSADRSR